MKTILKYIGMKDIDLNKYGFNHKIYCEPFSGSYNTGFKLMQQLESTDKKVKFIYNDLDVEIVNFWNCVKTDSNKLINMINKLVNVIQECDTDIERQNIILNWGKSEDKFKRASSEYVYNYFNTLKSLKFGRKITRSLVNEVDFYLTSEYLKDIEINNTNYIDIINKYDSTDTFFLIDPPYAINKNYYNCNIKHEELYNIIKKLKGKWLLTYNDNDYIRGLYKEYNINKVSKQMFNIEYNEIYITK